MIDRSVPDWYKDAVIYQLHVKAFFDANNDGIGDFEGLIQKLDYVKSLGVTAIWLLPFYPSPLRDDGYDIADYRDVNPSYGTMRDFRRLVRECHKRDLRVITELVINHTSDQHPWFQRARRAKKGSTWRNFYVWSDDDERYDGTRIIFLDTESSNWTWDPEAGQFFWHRFYHHQPDLNFDNPQVLRAVLSVLHFWLKAGVDGLRLDAVPYLIEREGTNNENLPETHEILRKIRAEVDAHYPDRMLLAEANQWPEDTAEYFGRGDECHMAFHFPLMPRMYMALAMEDRNPITDILRQTPELPDGCQWAIFLRNHDELTLEMVTDDERDYLWEYYAADRRMRINLGIRRRLAPLMARDRRKIELMNGLLLSMPGTPVLYYGDELGMGDNIYLGDRDGVRTPMQWTPDRNGGFSRTQPQRLYLPAIQDPLYGYQAVNVESQEADPSSLLNWTKGMLRVRQEFQAFGRGSLEFLYPGNRKIFAYLRQYADETILCVVNLSRTAQAVELDLSEFSGRVPIELSGRTAFPPVGDLPYLLTLPGYGFSWFALVESAEAPNWYSEAPEPMPSFLTLVLRKSLEELTTDKNRRMLEEEILPDYLPKHRWFPGKDRAVESVSLDDTLVLPGPGDPQLLCLLSVRQDGETARYQLPLAVTWDEAALRPGSATLSWTLARTRRFRYVGALHDAMFSDEFACRLLQLMRGELPTDERLVVAGWDALKDLALGEDTEVRRFGVEQSNTSVVVGGRVALKLFRKLAAGIHPELEMVRYLTHEAGFRNTPALLGSVEMTDATGQPTALAIAQEYLFNQGDGWQYVTNYLDRELEARAMGRDQASGELPAVDHEENLQLIERLGQRVAEMHVALARPTPDPAFSPKRSTAKDAQAWARNARRQSREAFSALRRIQPSLEGPTAERAKALLERQKDVDAFIRAAAAGRPDVLIARLHGDLHLGQVLVVERDFYIIDFEGEPARPLDARREKSSALRDVAGMLRSFDYAAWSAAFEFSRRQPNAGQASRQDAMAWRDAAQARFLAGYRSGIGDCGVWPDSDAEGLRLVELFLVEKALYELAYEAANRPAWLDIPLAGLLALLDAAPGRRRSP